jgi:acetyl esterase/lipase
MISWLAPMPGAPPGATPAALEVRTLTAPVGPPPPPFDPELAAGLAALDPGLLRPLTRDLLPAKRAADALAPPPTDDELSQDGRYEVSERAIPGPPGAPDLSLLICRPIGAPTPAPAMYGIHGGGMIGGDHRRSAVNVLRWARHRPTVTLLSVTYRVAPETPHPGPVEDCYAGLLWTAANAAELGIDPDRLIIVGGSAGGGLAAAVALMARDRGGPALLGQMLLCPMLDDRNDTPSAHQMTGRGVWDRVSNETGWSALLGDARGGPDVSPYAAPARATDLTGLPPAFIDVGSAETFRDEDVAYASAIWRAGGQAELHVWPGGFHGFDGIVPDAQISLDAQQARLRWLDRLL